jgi:hypothetical protein
VWRRAKGGNDLHDDWRLSCGGGFGADGAHIRCYVMLEVVGT